MALVVFTTHAQSQDEFANRREAAESYEATVRFANMIEDSIQQMALSLPDDQRNGFVMLMRQLVDAEELRELGLDKMAEVFTAEELNALTDFYGSSVGQSIVTKFPVYMAEVLPLIQLQIMQAVRTLEQRVQ